jgi:peptidylprolyl isomerase
MRSMRRIFYFVLAGSCAAAAIAQTASKPASQAAKPATSTASSQTAHSAGATAKTASKLPIVHGVPRTAFSLRYIDSKIGTGKLAEPNKLYHVLYTGYLPSTGQIFDSSDKHRTPKLGEDKKPVIGPDGKPVLGDPQPLVFPQGFGRLIPGFDQGFEGMHVGGKRRIFIPWQLGYGTHEIPARGDNPGIPAKSDLVFDVELVDVTDMPTPPQRPMPPHPGAAPGAAPAHPATPGAPPAGAAPTAPAAPAKPAAPSTAPAPKTPPPASTPQPQAK